MRKNISSILIVFGITGDLSTRKVLPALSKLIQENNSFKDVLILGITRKKEVDTDALFSNVKDKAIFDEHLEIFQMDVDKADEYARLSHKLKELGADRRRIPDQLFYLPVPPQASVAILEMLGTSGLLKEKSTKILLEKPIGVDLKSAQIVLQKINTYLTKEQIYIIDHYLGKTLVQNFISFREHDSILKERWNNEYIERIEILASEEIGIEGRVAFYEKTGVLLDFVQSHLLQLTALTLMESGQKRNLHERKARILASLSVQEENPVYRGQYKSYRQEVDNPHSTIETFVSFTLESTDERWTGVPIVLTTGKKLDTKKTEIKIIYKKRDSKGKSELVFKIYPSSGLVPPHWAENSSNTDISSGVEIPSEGYEKVFIHAQNSNQDLFISTEEVLASWRILSPIQESWKLSNEDLFIYTEGVTKDEAITFALGSKAEQDHRDIS